MRPSFQSSGYDVVSLQLTPDVIDALLAEAKTRTYKPVFLEVGGAQDDAYRSQSRVTRLTSNLRLASRAVEEDAAVRDENYQPRAFFYMHSRPGGTDQEPQQDYTADVIAAVDAKFPGTIPASVVIALEPGTKLRVFPGCFDYPTPQNELVLDIPPGYAAVFRGDLFHSGVGYATSNYRLHCFLFCQGLNWNPDVVSSTLFVCQFCGYTDNTSNRIRQHRYYCSENPAGEAHRLARREQQNRRGVFSCPHCNYVVDVASTLRSLIGTHHK